jgi:hypothetical protein
MNEITEAKDYIQYNLEDDNGPITIKIYKKALHQIQIESGNGDIFINLSSRELRKLRDIINIILK